MADAFISYVRSERDNAEALAAALLNAGYSVWWDRELIAGDEFERVIDSELKAAKAILVLWSKAAARSTWVRSEADYGFKQGKLIPLRTDDAELPRPFDQVHTLDFTNRRNGMSRQFREINRSVAACVAGRPPALQTPGSATSTRKPTLNYWLSGIALLGFGVAGVVLYENGRNLQELNPPVQTQSTDIVSQGVSVDEERIDDIATLYIAPKWSSNEEGRHARAVIRYFAQSPREIDAEIWKLLEGKNLTAAIKLAVEEYDANFGNMSAANRISALLRLAILTQHSEPQISEGYLEELIELDPKNFRAHARLGRVYYQQSKSTLAHQHFEKALGLDAPAEEERLGVEVNYATSLMIAQRLDESSQRFSRALDDAKRAGLDSVESRILTRQAYMQLKREDYDGAKKILSIAIAMQTSDERYADLASSLSVRGRIAEIEGKFDKALVDFNTSFAIEESQGRILGQVDTLYYIGTTNLALGNLEEAQNSFTLGLRLATAKKMGNMRIKHLIGHALVDAAEGNMDLACQYVQAAEVAHTGDITYNQWTKAHLVNLGCGYVPLGLKARD